MSHESAANLVEKHIETLANRKESINPKGYLNREAFNELPLGTTIYLVWSLGPASWITVGKTRELNPYDTREDHLGGPFVFEKDKLFIFTRLESGNIKAGSEPWELYDKEYYDSYNLGTSNYNESYVFTDRALADKYLKLCKSQPRFKNAEEEAEHKALTSQVDSFLDYDSYVYDPQDAYMDDPRDD